MPRVDLDKISTDKEQVKSVFKKPGRKEKHKGGAKQVAFYCSTEQADYIKGKAFDARQSVSDYIFWFCLENGLFPKDED